MSDSVEREPTRRPVTRKTAKHGTGMRQDLTKGIATRKVRRSHGTSASGTRQATKVSGTATRKGATRVCPRCNHQNGEQVEHCAGCGAQLVTAQMTALSKDARELIGKVINGKYEVLSVLGIGGMGVVYKVRHLILESKNLFALKVLHPNFSTDGQFRARFLREVEVAMELTHENIIQIRDFGLTEGNLLFFTMDFFAGDSLKSMIQTSAPIPAMCVVQLIRQVLAALTEAHKCGVVHRDLKPDNILVQTTADGGERVKILDFGIAKTLATSSADNNLTQGAVIGSPRYMSPEQVSDESVDQRSDLYSVGIILYEMLTGKVPFDAKTTRTILMQHLTASVPPFEKTCPGVQIPARLRQLVSSLLEKDRDKRPLSAAAVRDVLDGNATVDQLPVRRLRQFPWLHVAAVLLAFGLGSFAWYGAPWLSGIHATGDTTSTAVEAEEKTLKRELQPLRRTFRCQICSKSFLEGELDGNKHHDLPLVE